MVDAKFIAEQMALSRSSKSTTQFLRGFVLHIVDVALSEHYGANYSDRCLQASVLIQHLLADFGISSKLFVGALCAARATKGAVFDLGWGGFWDENQHAWVVTEFYELVDLTIAQLHLHPASSHEDDEPIPALWWQPIDLWPPILKYLPEGIGKPELDGKEAEDLDKLKTRVIELRDDLLATRTQSELGFSSIAHGPEHLQQMTIAGNPWLNKSLLIQEREIPLPPWVQRRLDELMKPYR